MSDIRFAPLVLDSNAPASKNQSSKLVLNKQILAQLNNTTPLQGIPKTKSDGMCSGCGPCYSITLCNKGTNCTGAVSGCDWLNCAQ